MNCVRYTVPLVLASESPRRKELLSQVFSSFEVVSSGVEEDSFLGPNPAETARQLAVLKAASVARKLERGAILGADTVIDLDGELLGKPINAEDAVKMLRRLRGRRHQVVTGVAVQLAGTEGRESVAVATEVRMRDFSDGDIQSYVSSGEPLDKAGAYAIQGLGADLIAEIRGCYNNVVGLPVCEVVGILERFGFEFLKEHSYCRFPSGKLCPRESVGR